MLFRIKMTVLIIVASFVAAGSVSAGVFTANGATTNNGWYNGEQIYYIDQGAEKKTERQHLSDIFLIGGPRIYQANVVETIPGAPGYSPHWDVAIVRTADGVIVQDIIDAGLASDLFESDGVLFDNADDILEAEFEGLVTITEPGLIVNCPIVSVSAADAPGNVPASEDFERLTPGSTF
jgi:hypothetical protein